MIKALIIIGSEMSKGFIYIRVKYDQYETLIDFTITLGMIIRYIKAFKKARQYRAFLNNWNQGYYLVLDVLKISGSFFFVDILFIAIIFFEQKVAKPASISVTLCKW